jgi:uncharacterized LabA/DUF88 family protein
MKNTITYVFIDAQNLHLGVKKDVYRNRKKVYSGWEIDYKRFYIFLKDKYKTDKVFLFIGRIDKYNHIYKNLKNIGYKLIFKEVSLYSKNNKVVYKGNIDTLLVLTVMKLEKEYDDAIIVSGDGDFLCLIDYLFEHKKLKRILIPNREFYSHLLHKYKNVTDFIGNFRNKIKK